jgi:hypothetical protein
MAKTVPEVFKDLHYQVLEVGLSQNRAMNYINNRIDSESLQIPKINNQNMSTHFATHITIPERINAELVKLGPGQEHLRQVNPEVGVYIEDMVRRKVGNDVNDYLNLDQLRAQLMDKMTIMDELVAKTDDQGNSMVDLAAYECCY